MKTREEILRILREELPYLRERFRVIRVGLFGSYARGEHGPGSDIDILVELEPPVGFFGFIALEDYLSEKLGAKVDLVTPDALKPIMKPHVLEGTVYA
ncbi:MAG: DNA polymerase III subunit beta [Thermoplasmata archaeon]|nr:DNA polymerase III subunit beta [Thermoplasmata archaeon]